MHGNSKHEIINAVSAAFRELESQKYALDQSAIVAITDIRGDIVYVNDKFCDISKYSEQELLGQNHRIINSGHHPKSFFAEMWKTISSGSVWKGDIKNKAKDGSFYWVATTITPFMDENGLPNMFVSIRFDISRQKALEEELEEKLKERNTMLNRMSVQNRQLEDFCYIISHNLRAPVYNLGLICDLMKEEENKDELPEMLEKLSRISEFLRSTLDELIDTVQINNSTEISVTSLRFESSLAKNMAVLNAQITESGAQIHADFTAIETLQYHEAYLDSILQNLLSNAIKYRSEQRPLEIHISSALENGWVVLRFKDNGRGINMQAYGDLLFKFKKTFHRNPQGKGIGLYMIKNQIEAAGGHIHVTGGEEQGLAFEIFLTKAEIK